MAKFKAKLAVKPGAKLVLSDPALYLCVMRIIEQRAGPIESSQSDH